MSASTDYAIDKQNAMNEYCWFVNSIINGTEIEKHHFFMRSAIDLLEDWKFTMLEFACYGHGSLKERAQKHLGYCKHGNPDDSCPDCITLKE